MLDNHFVVRRAARVVRTGLTREFERRLPRARKAGLGRTSEIEQVAAAMLRETDGLVDRPALVHRVRALAATQGVSLAELWALPLYLRLLLIEQLAADGPSLLERPVDGLVDQRVANGVRSLLMIEKTDWARFVEEVSEVHVVLARDPAGLYLRMDFETRDRYRRAVESIARARELDEVDVARRAIELAARAEDQGEALLRHVGYYLLDAGRPQLDGARGPKQRRRWLTAAYVGAIVLVAAVHLVAAIVAAQRLGADDLLVAIIGVLAVVPAWSIGVGLINWLVTLTVRPTPLAKLDLATGVPSHYRTLVVVPGMLTHRRDAEALLDRIEDHFLATREVNVEFALLTDFGDADTAETDADDELLEHARRGVAALNDRYRKGDHGPFHLFHRRRVWSERQGRWMGWERKRGKLEELNRLLRECPNTTYVVHEGREGHYPSIRYVITLDADTIMPPGAARRMIETLAHPLNVARFDPEGEQVVAGYTVLQPRIDLAPEAAPSRFALAYAGDGSFDIYSRAASDVYQDLFGEGVFVGKGIYDLDAFRASLEGRFPCDRILSHDLIEGIHGRAGLVTDVVLYEDYPRSYLAYARRLHRWIRGDWQLLAWLGPWVPSAEGRRRNRLSPISRWKILDNLRRSLLLPTLVAMLVFAWLSLPHAAWIWTVLALILLATPLLSDIGDKVVRLRPSTLRPLMSGMVGSVPQAAVRWLLRLSFMAHEAWISADAIARALVRTTVTRRRQLEWTPAAVAGRGTADPRTIVRELGPSTLFALALATSLILVEPLALLGTAPLLLAWAAAPALALWTARPSRRAPARAEPAPAIDDQRLRRLARRTWAYFERVVGPEDHWLPPDHLQEHPKGEVAHRTSPTNVAMALLSTISAYDLGYLDLLELVVRLRNTLESLGAVPRLRGHFLNWCDTTTLAPLEPRYVSTVDSGNLAIALLIVEQTTRELCVTARPFERRFAGLGDSLDVLAEALAEWGPAAEPARQQVEQLRARFLDAKHPRAWLPALEGVDQREFVELDRALLRLFEAEQGRHQPAAFEQLRAWAGQARRDVASLHSELAVQLPWLAHAFATPGEAPELLKPTLAILRAELENLPELGRAVEACERALELLGSARARAELPEEWRRWLERLEVGLHTSLEHALALRERLLELAERAASLVAAMDFGFLYDRDRELMYIGYDASAERYDEHHYDLLASEARLASLIAIAKGDAPVRHWAKLGRPIGRFGADRALLSWSGTMFEYLMPPLLVDEGRGTLLDVSAHAAVRAQIEHGRRNDVPWGVSESGYARLDSHLNYQYRAFGVAETGFRRELDRELVIAPYASLMALRYAPAEVEANLARVVAAEGLGPLGAYEALDYTRERLQLGQSHAVVRSYMSHHQGMILLALHGHLCKRAMIARTHRHPLLRAVELLLRERAPGRVPVERPQPAEEGPPARARVERVQSWPATPGEVEAHLIGNGRYSVIVTSTGCSHSWWKDHAITRNSDDPVLADEGFAITVRERDGDHRWSFFAAVEDRERVREVEFAAHGAHLSVHAHDLIAELEVVVAADIDAELRVVRLTERGGRRRRLTITGIAEIALAPPNQHDRHPAFSRLFVASQVCSEPPMILCRRRAREPDEATPWIGCALISDHVEWTGYELDRSTCRSRDPRQDPRLRPLPNKSTPMIASLDPCAALEGELELEPNSTVECAFVIIAADSRAELLDQAERLRSMALIRRALLEAERAARAQAEELGEDTRALIRTQRLLSTILYPRERLRAPADVLARNQLGQPGLWRHGISGDNPMVVVRVGSVGVATVAELVRTHHNWRERGLGVDLILIEDQALGYGGDIRQRLVHTLERAGARLNAAEGGVFLLHGGALDEHERDLVLGCAALVLDAEGGDLLTALDQPRVAPLPAFEPEGQTQRPTPALERPRDLVLDNGHGGFSPDGREYVIHLEPGQATPAPWVNTLANPEFGCVISERGSGYTWAQNAGLNRLSAWSNDPVNDPPSESLYLRDELDGEVWSPLPAPAPAPAPYQVRHGAGYSSFEHASHGLRQRVEVFVDPEWSVKFVRVRLEDLWDRPRRLTMTMCVEWLLGGRRPADTKVLLTDFEPSSEIALARNPWNPSFGSGWAFAAASEALHGMTSSRAEFFGLGGDRARPAALDRIGLSGDISQRDDACAALQVHLDLEAGGGRELHFVIGWAEDREAAVELADRCRAPAIVDERRAALERRWDALLGAIEVRTPDREFDLLCNRWLLYQCIASRLWARTGFYQSSGAFGFRDQLQDVLALIHAAPELCRAHLLDAAGRQYQAGDVQHWWHPPTGQGLRSRCSDDLLWLPFAVAAYVEATGDAAVLDERAPYLDQPPLAAGEIERYEAEPRWSGEGTLYEHCMRALARARTRGVHGLPLIGSCDWNDGFSRVGLEGRGESVWLGWFYAVVALDFARVSERLGQGDDAHSLRRAAASLTEPLEAAWDGAWYRRAYDDDGVAIGAAGNAACEIDSLAQSWAVLSRLAPPSRAHLAMDEVWSRLVDRDAGIVRLFTPAFAGERPTLGYIESYPPGVRENGGQYTHAAVWVAWAFAELGEHDRAYTVWRMIVPTHHGSDPESIARYRVEPYAIAADIYGEPPHVGRGGWTWYTGAAGWAYRCAIEGLLGVRRVDGRVSLAPVALPSAWPGFEIIVRDREHDAEHRIRVERLGPEHRLERGFALIDGVARALPISLPTTPGVHALVVGVPDSGLPLAQKPDEVVARLDPELAEPSGE
jgi:cyclic beta-1,2-glucan synthetase